MKKGGCQYVHDDKVRREALKRRRVEKAARDAQERKNSPAQSFSNVRPTQIQKRSNGKQSTLVDLPVNTSKGGALKPSNAKVVTEKKENTQPNNQHSHNKPGASNPRNWKNDSALRASRIKLQEKYDQSKDCDLQSASLQRVHVHQPTEQPACPRGSVKSVRISDDVQIRTFSEEVDLACIANKGEVDEKVLVPHEIVVGFIKQIEDKHHLVVCHPSKSKTNLQKLT